MLKDLLRRVKQDRHVEGIGLEGMFEGEWWEVLQTCVVAAVLVIVDFVIVAAVVELVCQHTSVKERREWGFQRGVV